MALLIASMAFSAGAMAAPGGQGQGNGPSSSPGNPHQPGTKGNPHQPGTKGNPHQGNPPYGKAIGQLSGSSGGGGGALHSNGGVGGNGDEGGGSLNSNRQGHTLICHATGSKKHPFVVISPANPGVQNGHAGHQGGRDIIPAPPGASKHHPEACESGAQGTAATRSATGGGDTGTNAVLGAVVSSSGSPGDAPAADTAASAQDAKGTLPFTGLAALTLASIGVVLLFGGWLVRVLGLRQRPEER